MNRLINKTSLALSLSLFGAVSSMSALAMTTDNKHQVHEIEITADDSDLVNVFVSIDGEVTDVKIPKSALEDQAQLADVLVDIPQDVREKLIESLSSLNHEDKMVKIEMKGGDNDVSWVSNADSEHVIVLHKDTGEHSENIVKKVVREFKHISHDGNDAKVFKFKHGGKLSADSLIRMLDRGDFTAEDLDKIQQALDKKR